MEVRFVSSLTPEDEERYVSALLAAVTGLLDKINIAYTLQIRTSGDKVFHHSRLAKASGEGDGTAQAELPARHHG